MIRCLRKTFPLAQIDMAVRADFLDLISNNPHLDRKLSIDRKEGFSALLKFRRGINQQHYDVIYDAHRSLRTRLLMPFLKCEQKLYFEKHYLKRALALTLKIKGLIKGSKRMLERYLEPLSPLGVRYDGLGPELFANSELEPPLPKDSHKWVGLIPSAQWPGKRWAPENFRETLLLLLERTSEKFLIFGGPSDLFCSDIARDLPSERVLNMQGKLNLKEVFSAMGKVKLCISNDTGLMHVADAMGVPNVLIFGPTNADMGCLPFNPQSVILEHNLWCRPCSKNGQAFCIRGKRLCLELTTPQQVSDATCQILNSLPQQPT